MNKFYNPGQIISLCWGSKVETHSTLLTESCWNRQSDKATTPQVPSRSSVARGWVFLLWVGMTSSSTALNWFLFMALTTSEGTWNPRRPHRYSTTEMRLWPISLFLKQSEGIMAQWCTVLEIQLSVCIPTYQHSCDGSVRSNSRCSWTFFIIIRKTLPNRKVESRWPDVFLFGCLFLIFEMGSCCIVSLKPSLNLEGSRDLLKCLEYRYMALRTYPPFSLRLVFHLPVVEQQMCHHAWICGVRQIIPGIYAC